MLRILYGEILFFFSTYLKLIDAKKYIWGNFVYTDSGYNFNVSKQKYTGMMSQGSIV